MEERDQTIGQLGAEVESMEADASSGQSVDLRHVHQTQRRIATLTRQNERLVKPTVKARQALRALREREQRSHHP
jgi:hypothetical protein